MCRGLNWSFLLVSFNLYTQRDDTNESSALLPPVHDTTFTYSEAGQLEAGSTQGLHGSYVDVILVDVELFERPCSIA